MVGAADWFNGFAELGLTQSTGVVGGVLELVFPAQNLCLGTIFFGGGLVAFFHPDARKCGVDVEVVRVEGVGAFGCAQGVVESAQVKIYLGEGMPGGECIRRLVCGAREFFKGGGVVAHREIERGVIDKGLDLGVGHAVSAVYAELAKNKGRP